jgi:quercetin dioxygenase-like cupin family protein
VAASEEVRVVVAATGQAARQELEPGVVFRPLIGGFNSQASVTVGWVNFAPLKGLSCHEHPYAELLAVMAGEMLVQVEERAYLLQAGDALCVPARTPHQASNRSANRPARLWIAMAAAEPSRTLVPDRFVRRLMPSTSLGEPGKEQVVRRALPLPQPHGMAAELGPRLAAGGDGNARRASWFSEAGLPGIEMGALVLAAGCREVARWPTREMVVLAVRGRCQYQLGDQRQVLGEGTAMFVPAGQECVLENGTAGEAVLIWVGVVRRQ